MNEFSEDNLIEQTAVKIFGELWKKTYTHYTRKAIFFALK